MKKKLNYPKQFVATNSVQLSFKLLIMLMACLMSLLFTTLAFAQAPHKMSYQAVIRNASNMLVMNQAVGMRLSILQGSPSGTPVYVELHNPTTNANGLLSVEIGTGALVIGSFSNIDWTTGPYFIKTETDPLGGIVYTISGTSQMLTVPYAFFAEKANTLATPIGKTYLILSGNVTNAQAAAQIASEVGPNTQFIWIQNTTVLTTVNLSNITNVIDIKINNNAALTNVNFNGLNYIVNDLTVGNNTAITSLSFPALTKLGGTHLIHSNGALTSLSFPLLTEISSAIQNNISYNVSLTSLSFPSVTSVGYFEIAGMLGLTSLSFPNLTTVANRLKVGSSGAITNIVLPNLTTAAQLEFSTSNNLSVVSAPLLTTVISLDFYYDNGLTNINMPLLTTAQNISGNTCNLLGSISFPALTTVNSFAFYGTPLVTSLSLPLLVSASSMSISSYPLLTTVNLNSLTTTNYLSINFNPILTSISLPALSTALVLNFTNVNLTSLSLPSLNVLNGNFYAQGCKLSSSQVNTLLNKFLTVTPTSGSIIAMNGQVPLAPPTGAGITAKATLVANGQTVYTD
jgi:hypothetical protein